MKDLSEGTNRDLMELRERVVRLEVQLTETNKKIESLTNYTRQLYEYLNKQSR